MTRRRHHDLDQSVRAIADGGEGEDFSDKLLLLGEQTALRQFFDETDWRRLRFILWLLCGVFLGYAAFGLIEGRPLRGAVALAIALVDLLVLRARHSRFLAANVRQTAAIALIGHFVLLQLFHFNSTGGVIAWFLAFPLMAARFRLADGEILALFGSLYAVLVLRLTIEVVLTRQGIPIAELVSYGLWFAVMCLVASRRSRRAERKFLANWRRENGRQRDRLRMKQELEYAREIQLSMLPRQAPRQDWVELAALSLPATEVGGDYYDYFQLENGRLAVVIGDVTGHGVASGLVLSGVRSSLNLIQDELDRPERVLARVNRMLKRTSSPRMLMTLGLAVLDPDGTVTLASAGHPLALLVRAGHATVVEVGYGALPLGVRDDAEYSAETIRAQAGDVLVLYSDGVVEAVDAETRLYGYARLRDVVAREAGRGRAQEIRDAVLRDVWDFKGERDQADDITLVVMRWAAAAAASGEQP